MHGVAVGVDVAVGVPVGVGVGLGVTPPDETCTLSSNKSILMLVGEMSLNVRVTAVLSAMKLNAW